ncbi:hypothetical protein [Brumimicrobium mesophilum]|uniref:hypothetical protein n=1 Tax=Brumimicrobium mesophilum TaxID=392717 RepID=UPI000D1423EA|nr:hypothetical protein [Brumimicrobium mesophilum]
MGLFSFYTKKNNIQEGPNRKKLENNDTAYIWLDDYCQNEMVLAKNIEFIKSQTLKIFENSSGDKNGFNHCVERQQMPFSTIDQEFRVDGLERFLIECKIPKFPKIKKESKRVLTYEKSDNKVFGYHNFKLFFDIEGAYIKNLWFELGLIVSVEQINLINELFYNLGESYDLVIIDWFNGELIDLRDKRQISNYTHRMFK